MISWRLYTNSAVLILITLAWLIAKWITNLDVKKLSSFADPSDNGNYFNLRQWLPPNLILSTVEPPPPPEMRGVWRSAGGVFTVRIVHFHCVRLRHQIYECPLRWMVEAFVHPVSVHNSHLDWSLDIPEQKSALEMNYCKVACADPW